MDDEQIGGVAPEAPSPTDATRERALRFGRLYAVALMSLVSASQLADRQLLSIVMEPLKHEFNLSDTQIGILNGTVFGTAYAIGALPFAVLADRWSRKKIIAATLAFWSVMTALTGAAASYLMLAGTRALVGLGEAGAGPAMLALLARKFPPDKRAGMVAMLTVVTSLGAFAAFWMAGAVTQHFGWRALFLVFGLPGLALSAVIWWTLDETGPAQPSAARPMFAEVRRTLFCAPLLHLFAVAGWNGVISAGTQGWMSSFLIRTFQMSFSDVGFWMGVSAGLAGVVGAVVGGIVTNRWSRRDPLAGMRLCLAVLVLNLPLSMAVYIVASKGVAVGLFLLSTTVVGVSGPPIASQLLNDMPDRVRATVMAIVSMGVLFIAGLGPAIVGLLSDWMTTRGHADGLRIALMIVAAVGILPILHLIALLRLPGRRDSLALA